MTYLWAEWKAPDNTIRRVRFQIIPTLQHHQHICKTGWRHNLHPQICIHDTAYYQTIKRFSHQSGRRRGHLIFVPFNTPLAKIKDALRNYLHAFHDIQPNSLTLREEP